MTSEELQERTLAFAVAIYAFMKPLFRDAETRHVAQQLVNCSSSVAANYRACCVARSRREWLAKMGVVREESDESVLWLLFVQRTGLAAGREPMLTMLLDEARQLTRIFVASYRTGQSRK
jgi:four helix bundle protein